MNWTSKVWINRRFKWEFEEVSQVQDQTDGGPSFGIATQAGRHCHLRSSGSGPSALLPGCSYYISRMCSV